MNQLGVGLVLDGRLRLLEPVAMGAGGAVWRAVDQISGREVAVKALQAHQVGDAVAQARFRLVARTVTQLSHPAIAEVYEYGEGDLGAGVVVPYVVRELVTGETLEQRLASGPLPASEALRILGAVADALAVAHRAGTVHGNIEPANIVLGADGVKITDFGLATLRGPLPPGRPRGPLAYPAPELAVGSAATPAADMYSLGVVFVACLTGIAGSVPGGGMPGAADPVPASMAALWAACLGANPQDRPSAAHVAVMSRQIPVPRELEPIGSRAGAQRAAQPAAAAAVRESGHSGRVRAPFWRRSRGVVIGGAVATLAAGVVALTQIPSSSPADQVPGAAAGSSAVASASSPGTPGSLAPAARGATPEVASSSPALTPLTAISDLSATVQRGIANGQIRQDVGVDFKNFIQPAEADIVAGRPAGVPQLVATLRVKLKQRAAEGSITPGIDQMMSSELDTLLDSVSH